MTGESLFFPCPVLLTKKFDAMRTQRMIAAVALGLFLGVTGQAKADYDFTTIDAPGATLTAAQEISASGQIVGLYDDAAGRRHGFLLCEGEYTTLDVPGAI
jgi:hypothetical protein